MRESDKKALSYLQIVSMFKEQGYNDKNGWLYAITELFPDTVRTVSTTFHQLLSSCNFDYVNDNITEENFPITEEPNENTEYVLVHLNKVATTEEVEAEINRRGLTPATLADLLAYVKKNPNKQKEFPIVALGSRWRGPRGRWGSPYADHWRVKRNLDLGWRGLDWLEDYRFLACKR